MLLKCYSMSTNWIICWFWPSMIIRFRSWKYLTGFSRRRSSQNWSRARYSWMMLLTREIPKTFWLEVERSSTGFGYIPMDFPLVTKQIWHQNWQPQILDNFGWQISNLKGGPDDDKIPSRTWMMVRLLGSWGANLWPHEPAWDFWCFLQWRLLRDF